MGKNKLKIGLLIDSFEVSAWEYAMLEKIQNSHFAQITIAVINNNPQEKRVNYFNGSFESKNSLYAKYQKYENRKFKVRIDALEKKDAACLFHNTGNPPHSLGKQSAAQHQTSDEKPVHKNLQKISQAPNLTTITAKPVAGVFPPEVISQINDHKLDVFVRIGFKGLKGDILTSAKCGIWSYHYSENPQNPETPPGFWEVLYSLPTTAAVLLILGESPEKHQIIYRTFSSTAPYSVNMNRNPHLWKCSSFIPRRLNDLYDWGEKEFLTQFNTQNKEVASKSGKRFKKPGNSKVIIPLSKHMFKRTKDKILGQFIYRQWMLLFDLQNDNQYNFPRYKKLIPPKNRLWADPFPVYENGKYYVFIEEAILDPKRGYICVIVMDEYGNCEKPIKLIENPYHMSYPLIFDWDGERYMMPETSQNKTVGIYKCQRFPDKWVFYKNIMENIEAVDSTPFFHEDKWWLFVNIKENKASTTWDELFLFYSDSPISDSWTPHPLNPLISDTRRARPAGYIFRKNGKIYRPSQNCAKCYGYGLVINEILTLNEKEYQEKIVESFEPDWDRNLKAVHTYNKTHNLTLIDGKFNRSKFL